MLHQTDFQAQRHHIVRAGTRFEFDARWLVSILTGVSAIHLQSNIQTMCLQRPAELDDLAVVGYKTTWEPSRRLSGVTLSKADTVS